MGTKWANKTRMNWSPKKCFVLSPRRDTKRKWLLAGEVILEAETAEYLGIVIDNRGITEENTVDRIGKAVTRLHMMKSLRMFRGEFKTERCLKLYKTVRRPLWEYVMHLTPISVRVRRKLHEMTQELMSAMFGKWARRHTQRISRLCLLEPEKYRSVRAARP